jgi:hypothetical protein
MSAPRCAHRKVEIHCADCGHDLPGQADAYERMKAAFAAAVAGPLADLQQRIEAVEARLEQAAVPAAPRHAYTKQEAADSLGISVDSFEKYVQPHVRLVRKGKHRMIPVPEVEKWLDRNADDPLRRKRASA